MEPAEKKTVIVLVHGTFANKEKNAPVKPKAEERDGWWKPGNQFSERLKENLGDLEPEVRPFAWSSENKERDRHEAGQKLLDKMVQLEKEGRDYHLIGHSHGGSVIWIALVQSMMRRWKSSRNEEQLNLPHLKSWATLGTPFLHYRPNWIGQWYGIAATMLTLILTLMMMLAIRGQWLCRRKFDLGKRDPAPHYGQLPDYAVQHLRSVGSCPDREKSTWLCSLRPV